MSCESSADCTKRQRALPARRARKVQQQQEQKKIWIALPAGEAMRASFRFGPRFFSFRTELVVIERERKGNDEKQKEKEKKNFPQNPPKKKSERQPRRGGKEEKNICVTMHCQSSCPQYW